MLVVNYKLMSCICKCGCIYFITLHILSKLIFLRNHISFFHAKGVHVAFPSRAKVDVPPPETASK